MMAWNFKSPFPVFEICFDIGCKITIYEHGELHEKTDNCGRVVSRYHYYPAWRCGDLSMQKPYYKFNVDPMTDPVEVVE